MRGKAEFSSLVKINIANNQINRFFNSPFGFFPTLKMWNHYLKNSNQGCHPVVLSAAVGPAILSSLIRLTSSAASTVEPLSLSSLKIFHCATFFRGPKTELRNGGRGPENLEKPEEKRELLFLGSEEKRNGSSEQPEGDPQEFSFDFGLQIGESCDKVCSISEYHSQLQTWRPFT